jgi:hypothetical protein
VTGSRRGLELAACVALASAAGAARAEPPATAEAPAPAPPAPRTIQCTEGHDRQHQLGFLLDAGQGQASYGVRYLNQYRVDSGCGGLGGTAWFGFGPEIRGDGASAMEFQAVVRAGIGGDAIPAGVELSSGAATTFGRTIATGTATFVIDFNYFGLGAAYRFPIGADRPSWLGGLEFALRIHVPLFTYDVERKERQPPRSDAPPR